MKLKGQNQKKIILVGDLVTHVLYASDWIALVLSVTRKKNKDDMEALIHMVPGSNYQYFFEKRFSQESRSRGWISTRWLLKMNNLID